MRRRFTILLVVLCVGGVNNLAILTCDGNLTITGGTLNLEADSAVGPDGILTLSGGSLNINGSFPVAGTFEWTGGQAAGDEGFVVEPDR